MCTGDNSYGSQIRQQTCPYPFSIHACPTPSSKRTIFTLSLLFVCLSFQCFFMQMGMQTHRPLSTWEVAHYLLWTTPCFSFNASWRSFHITAEGVSMFSWNATQYSIVWMTHSLFHQSPINGSLNRANLFYYKQCSSEKPPILIILYIFRCTCREKVPKPDHWVTAFAILTYTAKLAFTVTFFHIWSTTYNYHTLEFLPIQLSEKCYLV